MNKKILLLEDQKEFRTWISSILGDIFPQHEIICAASIDCATELVDANEFSIAILDICLPDGSGISILKHIKQSQPTTLCIMSTIFDDHKNIFSALQAGADGYIIKGDSRDAFKNSLERITKGEPPLSPAVARMIMGYFKQNQPVNTEHNLSERQVEILTMIAQGMNSREVANELGLSIYTIMDHIKKLYEKLSITSRAEAAICAQKLGLIS